jgi:cell division septum initiation protein DivIVA
MAGRSPKAEKKREKARATAAEIEEHLKAGDERFLGILLNARCESAWRGLAWRWYTDKRPFARGMLLRYIDDGCDRPHHRLLVKRLLALAEEAGDDEAMGHFMVAYDRLCRRKLGQRMLRDKQGRRRQIFGLVRDRSIPSRLPVDYARLNREAASFRKRFKLRAKDSPLRVPKRYQPRLPAARFSWRTRRYLQRRAFRYFRGIGRADKLRYGRGVARALLLYRDEHLATPEALLDAWGFVNALYWGSPVLDRGPHGAEVARGRSLSKMTPAPLYPEIWRGRLDDILTILERARSRAVRAFALALLRREYAAALKALPLSGISGSSRAPARRSSS